MEFAQSVVIENATRIDFCSEINQRPYSITVARPLVTSPGNGYPVFYVLDGYWYFGSAVEALRQYAPEVAVVGIGYPDDPAYVDKVLQRHQTIPVWHKGGPPSRAAAALERFYDLSLPASNEVLTGDLHESYKVQAADVGGLDAFLKVIETEIKPRVAATMGIDSSNQAIFGHSLGGLTVVHALFVEPNAFRTYIAASPSIWWNGKAVLGAEAKFADAVRAGTATPRILITMGGEEETPDRRFAAKFGLNFAEYSDRLRRHRMVENARELTDRLKALRGTGDFEVDEYAVFPKQAHGVAPWPALGRAVCFAFPR